MKNSIEKQLEMIIALLVVISIFLLGVLISLSGI